MFKKNVPADQKIPQDAPITEKEVVDTPITEDGITDTPIAEDEVIDAIARAAKAEAEVAAIKDRYIRLLADFDNMRKRHTRELGEMTIRANERLLKDLLPVYDNLDLAVSNAPKDSPFVEGVVLIEGLFRKTLEQCGMEIINGMGQPFNPNLHEALQMIPDTTVPANHIIQQFRKGWKLGTKVIRPAQVIVSAGVPITVVDTPETTEAE